MGCYNQAYYNGDGTLKPGVKIPQTPPPPGGKKKLKVNIQQIENGVKGQIKIPSTTIDNEVNTLINNRIEEMNKLILNEKNEAYIRVLSNRIAKALHRIQLLQMDGEVTIRDLGLIVRDLRGDKE